MYRFTTDHYCHPLDYTILEADSMKNIYHAAMHTCRAIVGSTSTIDYDLLVSNYQDNNKGISGPIIDVETGNLIAYIYVSPVRCSCLRYRGMLETDNFRKGWQEYCKE